DAPALRKLAQTAAEANLRDGKFDPDSLLKLQLQLARIIDPQVHGDTLRLLPAFEQAAARQVSDRLLLTEIKRLHGKAIIEVAARDWLRSIAGDEALALLGRIVELELNERTDGHKEPEPKKLSDRVTDDWLKNLAGQDQLRRLELSGTAITSAGLVH